MTVVHLDPVIAPAVDDSDRPGGPAHEMRLMTEALADDVSHWTDDRRRRVAGFFDELAPEWHTRDSPERPLALADALERGGPYPDGTVLEPGSGIGSSSAQLAERFGSVVRIELSAEMLRLTAPEPGPRVLGDGGRLPFADGSAAVIVLHNMFLFADEVDRLLQPDGRLVWVNSRGTTTPIHLPAEAIDDALPGEWTVTASVAGPATWAVAARV